MFLCRTSRTEVCRRNRNLIRRDDCLFSRVSPRRESLFRAAQSIGRKQANRIGSKSRLNLTPAVQTSPPHLSSSILRNSLPRLLLLLLLLSISLCICTCPSFPCSSANNTATNPQFALHARRTTVSLDLTAHHRRTPPTAPSATPESLSTHPGPRSINPDTSTPQRRSN